jgi:hypothetical protein
MKVALLKEYVKDYLITENNGLGYVQIPNKGYTYKELYDFLSFVKDGRKIKGALKFATSVLGSAGVESVLNLSTDALSKLSEESAGEAMSKFFKYLKIPDTKKPLKVLAKFYGVNDLNGLKGISIPNNVSNLIDDKIEELFIKHLVKLLEIKSKKSPDEKVDNDFVMSQLKDFTSNHSTTSGAYISDDY